MIMHIFLFFKSLFQDFKLDDFHEEDVNTCRFNIYLGKYFIGDIFLSEKNIIVLIRKGAIKKMNLNNNFSIVYDGSFLKIYHYQRNVIQFLITKENFKNCDRILNGHVNKITTGTSSNNVEN